MKTKFLGLLLVFSVHIFGQQDSLKIVQPHSQIFSLSPISKNIDRVNGLVFGVGHVDNKRVENQTINGFNVEINPAPIAGALMAFMAIPYLPDIIKNNHKTRKNFDQHDFKIKSWNKNPNLKLNGVNISTGCFFTNASMNGLNISLGNKFKNFNGISIAPLGTISDKQNGFSIGIINPNTNLNGATVGIYNQTYELKGLQFGLVNQVQNNKGIQIGVFNHSYSRGFQLGFWNKNNKRSFPIVNW